jgi:hypothetical protein
VGVCKLLWKVVIQHVVFKIKKAGCWWLTPIILVTQEAESRRTVVQSQPEQIVCKTLSWKNLSRKGAGRVAQGIDPESKPVLNPSTAPPKCILSFSFK